MKKIIIPVCLLVLVLSCKRKQNHRNRIEGKYISSYRTEYALGKDTLEITAVADESNFFRIIKTVTYQRIREGVLQPPQHGTDSLTGVYNENVQVLHENTRGIEYLFVPEKKVLIVDNRTYYKTK